MAKENKTQYALLSYLSKEPLSGYRLKARLQKIGRLFWSEANPQIYNNLKLLEQEGLVTSKVDPASGKRQSRIYQLTAAGKKMLLAWLEKPVQLTPPREEICLKMGTAYKLPKQKQIALLEDYYFQIQNEYQFYEDSLLHVKDEHPKNLNTEYILINLDYTRRILEAKMEWCKSTLRQVKSKKK